MRKILAALGLALLVGCVPSGGGSPPDTKVQVDVANTGTEAAYGEAKDWDGSAKQEFTVNPGESVSLRIQVAYRIKVHIVRISDNQVLLDDFWDVADLSHEKLTLIVVP